MRIAIWHNLPSGGGKRALHDQVTGLVQAGHHVEIWSPELVEADFLPFNSLAPEHILPFPAGPVLSRLTGKPVRRRSEERWSRAMKTHLQVCAAQIGRGDFEVLLAAPCRLFSVSGIAAELKKQNVQLPSVLYLQEPNRGFYEASPELPWLASVPRSSERLFPFYRSVLARFLYLHDMRKRGRQEWNDIRAFDLVLANSFYSRESISRAYGHDSRVCYLGVDTERFSPGDTGSPTSVPFVIGVGSMHRTKGVDTAIQAVAALAQPRPKLVWVTNAVHSIYREEMEAMARHLGVELELKVRIEDSELVQLLRAASLMIYCSRLEPFGYAPLEANACGTPVVAVAEGGVRETVIHGENGLLCQRDPAELTQAMERLLRDALLAERMGMKAREIAKQKWNLPSSIERLEDCLRLTVASVREPL